MKWFGPKQRQQELDSAERNTRTNIPVEQSQETETTHAEKKVGLDTQISRAITRGTDATQPLSQQAAVESEKTQPQMVPIDPAQSEEIENRWATDKAIEELTVQEEIKTSPAGSGKPRKKRTSLGRTNQIKTRLTDAELTRFHRRVKQSGLSQGDYLRSAALSGEIRIEERSMSDLSLLNEIALIRAELGRQGGLLKMVIKPNEGQRVLAPEEWNDLIKTIRTFENSKKRLAELEVKIQNGSTKTQN